jgi:MoaA/NifB/PqqE/SkfB family radical SAM enzyme
MLNVVEQIKSLGTCTLGLTGGEPLLRDDLEALVSAAAPEMVAIVFTSGHRLDTRRARRLAAAGVSCVTIGIESAAPEVHDDVRGHAGSFTEAESAAQACRAAGVYTALSTIGTRERIASGDVEAMYQLAARWGVGEFRILTPVATGAWAGCRAAMLGPEERRVLYDFHVDHNRRRGGPAVASFAYLEADEIFGCGAGFHHLFVDATGRVCPCDLMPLSFGNVTAEPLADIWKRMGETFGLPRRGCIMTQIAETPGAEHTELPLTQGQSERLCAMLRSNGLLPEGYRRLLRSPESITRRRR